VYRLKVVEGAAGWDRLVVGNRRRERRLAAVSNPDIAIAGAYLVCTSVFVYVIFRFLDSSSAQLSSGAEAESNTAEQLRKLRARRLARIHNINLQGDTSITSQMAQVEVRLRDEERNSRMVIHRQGGKVSRQWADWPGGTALHFPPSQYSGTSSPFSCWWSRIPEQPDDHRTITAIGVYPR
jgi:hypothetical protein